MKKRRQKKTATVVKGAAAAAAEAKRTGLINGVTTTATVAATTGAHGDSESAVNVDSDIANHDTVRPNPRTVGPGSTLQAEHAPALLEQTPQTLALASLKSYCQTHEIFISPCLSAQSYPFRGLGVYATRPVLKGMKLIHVPTKSLFTIQSIPESFMSKAARKDVSVHCALAMFLAFGREEDLGVYEGWMATWPRWESFAEEMPVFWGGDFRQGENGVEVEGSRVNGEEGRARKRRKTLSDTDIAAAGGAAVVSAGDSTLVPTRKLPVFSRAPGVDAFWSTQPSQGGQSVSSHLSNQATKIRNCVDAVDKHFPHLQIRSSASHDLYLRFLHMWSCVNTRCFYYLHPGQTAPEDSNEAMALCAFQDLFNHSDTKGCTSMFDRRGYFVHADRDYKIGEEILLRYGQHDNDMLWMEYGFFMDKNKHDTVRMDEIVLTDFDEKDKEELKQCEYLGQYNLKMSGVCYRTVVASYLGILDKKQWKRFIAGGLDPELGTAFEEVRLKAKKRIIDWVLIVRMEAEHNLGVILGIKDEGELTDCFVGETSLTEEQRQSKAAKVELSKRRKSMCVRRWKQVFDMSMSAIQEIEKEFPGSLTVGENDSKTGRDLNLTADEFVKFASDERT